MSLRTRMQAMITGDEAANRPQDDDTEFVAKQLREAEEARAAKEGMLQKLAALEAQDGEIAQAVDDGAYIAETTGEMVTLENARQHSAQHEAAKDQVRRAITSAERKEVDAQQALHKARLEYRLRETKRLNTTRSKRAQAVVEHVTGLAKAIDSLETANEKLHALLGGTGLDLNDGHLIGTRPLMRQLERELFRVRPLTIGGETLPGASHVIFEHPGEMKSFADEIEAANDYLIRTVERGPGYQEPSVPANSKTIQNLVEPVILNDLEEMPSGPTHSAASVPVGRISLLDMSIGRESK